MKRKRVIIIGAAGMDYHLFNTVFRNNKAYEVVAFTMAEEQNLGTTNTSLRRYPPKLAGRLYPKGIPTIPESKLEEYVKKKRVDLVVLAYSDIPYAEVMHKASRALASGADFMLVSPEHTMLKSRKPVIAVCAVRTGCGKSQTSRKIVKLLKDRGYRVVAIREPMPYGNLEKQIAMRFATYEDLKKHKCTIEEREEYEPYIERGLVVYSGVDYEKIIRKAEKEADVIVWDGGNNEVSFYVPDMLLVVADPHRPGDEIGSYPGEVNARLADYVIINKEDSAKKRDIETVVNNIKRINPKAKIIHANSKIIVEDPKAVRGKRVLIVEDGPTLTHGNMAYGAGTIAAMRYKCKIVDPRPYVPSNLKKIYKEFPQLGKVLPAMGYSKQQIKELEQTINKAKCDVVLSGTPIDLTKILKVNKPVIRVRYELDEKGHPNLNDVINEFLKRTKLK
ncbi:MAG: GTPase [Candidatus Diapherotrites archaeon]|nr:GTPase [Candidatus Diapherotrites archaeon]